MDSNPDGFISLEGDPEMGVDFYVSIQPLPAVLQTGTGHHHMDEIRWPPCAADELEPIPRAIKLAGSTAAGGYKIKTVVDCGACPNDVINQIISPNAIAENIEITTINHIGNGVASQATPIYEDQSFVLFRIMIESLKNVSSVNGAVGEFPDTDASLAAGK